MRKQKSHYSFIGMSGIGKSFFGKLIAAKLNYNFIDSDILIKNHINTSLSKFIELNSEETFKKLEEQIICTINPNQPSIIATGGSVIYSEKSIAYLKSISKIVFLHDPIHKIMNRIKNYSSRPIIMNKKSTIHEVFNERLSLYEKYADIRINYPKEFNVEEICNLIQSKL